VFVQPNVRADLGAVLVWIAIGFLLAAFWAGVGFGISQAVGAVTPDPPHHNCTYSKVTIGKNYGTSSAQCFATK
jgi:hypothetical protein